MKFDRKKIIGIIGSAALMGGCSSRSFASETAASSVPAVIQEANKEETLSKQNEQVSDGGCREARAVQYEPASSLSPRSMDKLSVNEEGTVTGLSNTPNDLESVRDDLGNKDKIEISYGELFGAVNAFLDSYSKVVTMNMGDTDRKFDLNVSNFASRGMSASHVSYRVRCGDTLSGLSSKFLGDSKKWRKLSAYEPNADSIDGNVIKENECIYIPQIADSWILYNPAPTDTYTSLARDLYGSWAVAGLLQSVNGAYGDRIYDDVIKLPFSLSFSNYVTTDEDRDLFSVCRKLLGSDKCAKKVAALNGLNVSDFLKVGQILDIPSSITKMD